MIPSCCLEFDVFDPSSEKEEKTSLKAYGRRFNIGSSDTGCNIILPHPKAAPLYGEICITPENNMWRVFVNPARICEHPPEEFSSILLLNGVPVYTVQPIYKGDCLFCGPYCIEITGVKMACHTGEPVDVLDPNINISDIYSQEIEFYASENLGRPPQSSE